MAFPTVQDADTKSGTVTSNSTSWTLTYPTNLHVGDLILAFVATDGDTDTTPSLPAGWTIYWSEAAGRAETGMVAAKVSDGTESGSFTLSLPASEQGAWRIFRIIGWYGTLADGLDVGLDAVQTGSTPDPPSLNPASWATEDTLWFAACAVDTSRTISVYPLADRNTADVSGGAGGATLGICSTTSAVSSLDPGTFTISASDDWDAFTIGIRPLASPAVYTQTATWYCPSGTTAVQAECRGGGGSGGNGSALFHGGGGAGGGYAKKNSVAVTAGTAYTVTVGTGGSGGEGNNGGDSWFSTSGTVIAKGGGAGFNATAIAEGAAGGDQAGDIGDVTFNGGGGAAGSGSSGGGGGGGAGDAANGTAGSGGTGGAGGSAGGGAGSNGVASGAAGAATIPGGGGGGGGTSSGAGGAGARGNVTITLLVAAAKQYLPHYGQALMRASTR